MKIPDKTSLGESKIQLRYDRHRELEDPHTVPCLQQSKLFQGVSDNPDGFGLPIQYHNGVFPDICHILP